MRQKCLAALRAEVLQLAELLDFLGTPQLILISSAEGMPRGSPSTQARHALGCATDGHREDQPDARADQLSAHLRAADPAGGAAVGGAVGLRGGGDHQRARGGGETAGGGLWTARLAQAARSWTRSSTGGGRRAEQRAVPLALPDGRRSADGDAFSVDGEQVDSADAQLKQALPALGARAVGAARAAGVLLRARRRRARFCWWPMRHGDRWCGAQLAPRRRRAAAGAALAERWFPAGEPAHFALVPVKRDEHRGVLARLVSGVADVREAALGPPELASADAALAAAGLPAGGGAPTGEDPVARASTRNRAVYGILLGRLLPDARDRRGLHRPHALPRGEAVAAEDRLRLAGLATSCAPRSPRFACSSRRWRWAG